jgi:serine/threonine protein phosphatase PrpC
VSSGSLPLTGALFTAEEMTDVEAWSLAGGTCVVFSAPSPEGGTNQDAAAVIPMTETSGVVAVADGLGGERGGARAAERAVRALADAVREREPETLLRTVMMDGFEAANRAVEALAVGATTLVALAIEDGGVRPYHVGDSSVLLCGGRGKLKLLTVSHSPVGFAVAAGVLDEDEAMHHKERHIVSNVLGSPDMRIEVGPRRRLAARDTAVLASDGLLDNLHTEEVVELARRGDPVEAALNLVEAARRRMLEPEKGVPSKPDDLTLALFRP